MGRKSRQGHDIEALSSAEKTALCHVDISTGLLIQDCSQKTVRAEPVDALVAGSQASTGSARTDVEPKSLMRTVLIPINALGANGAYSRFITGARREDTYPY
jgi:hypothetical protein